MTILSLLIRWIHCPLVLVLGAIPSKGMLWMLYHNPWKILTSFNYNFQLVSKATGRIFRRINFFVDATQPTFQGRINGVSSLWIAVELTLKCCWKWNKIRSQIFNATQHWFKVSVQHWNNVKSTLQNVDATILQRYTTSFQPFFQRWYHLNVVSTWSQRQLKLYRNHSG